MAVGGGAAFLIAPHPVPAALPLWSIAAALGVSALSGIGFGVYPEDRAAGLDPVEALGHE